ncbi:MAG: glycosyltransferase family 4 protein [Acidobacteriota bacterium]
MRILFVTDAFPPRCGGSGWSAYEQTRALVARGHHVSVLRPGAPDQPEFEGIPQIGFPAWQTSVPLLRHAADREIFPRRFRRFAAELIARERFGIVHAQHVKTGPASIDAARDCGIPSAITVRDYWPVCFWGTKMSGESRCEGCTPWRIIRCLSANIHALAPAAPAMMPYVRRYLKRVRESIAGATAVISISHRLKQELLSFLPENRITVIPNFAALDRPAPLSGQTTAPAYITYAGKFTCSKGIGELLEALRAAACGLPVVFIGEGPLRGLIETEIASGRVQGRITGWLERDQMIDLLAGGQFNLFPGRWDEPLGRVVIEAGAVGRTSVVFDQGNGGAREILEDGVSGVFTHSVAEFASAIRGLAMNPARALELGAAARRRVEAHFSPDAVIPRIEALYEAAVASSR